MTVQSQVYVRSLHIKNFRSIRQLDLEMPPEGIILVGKNNCGKTNVFRAMEILFNFGKRGISESDFPVQNWRGETSLSVELQLDDKVIGDAFGKEWRRRPDRITVTARAERNKGVLEWGIKTEHPENRNAGQQVVSALLPLLRERIEFLFVPSQRDPQQDAALESTGSLRRLVDLLFKGTWGKAGRRTKFEQSFEATLNKGTEVIERAEKRLLEIGGDYLGMKSLRIIPRVRRPAEFFEGFDFIASDGISEANLRLKGTGWQSAFVAMLLQYVGELRLIDQNVIFGIEEPEAYLHAAAERKVWGAVSSLSKKHQVVITTHSPIIVDAMDKSQWKRLRKMEKTKTGTLLLPRNELADKFASTYEMQCGTELSEILYADGVVFVEGPSDKAVWDFLLRDCVPSDTSIKVVDIGGCGRAKLFVDFAERYGCPWILLFDFDVILKGATGGDGLARFGRCESPGSKKRYLPESAIEEVKKEARNPAKDHVGRQKQVGKINDRLQKYQVLILPVDLEYELVTVSNEESVIKVLRNPDVVVRDIPSCYNNTPFSLAQSERLDLLRKAFGSKMLDGKGINDPSLKVRHVPRSVLAGIPKAQVSPVLTRYAKQIAEMMKTATRK